MLRAPARTKAGSAKPPSSAAAVIPPPYRGWNVRDKLVGDELTAGYASVLDNWVPGEGKITLRKGYVSHATGLPGEAETMLSYRAGLAQKMFACSDGGIYDVTSGGTVGAAAVSGLSNNKWRSKMFSTTGGTYLLAVNGADGLRSFDGSSWDTQTITGLAAADIDGIGTHNKRVWLIEKASLSAWYLPVLYITGTVTEFALGALFKRGGYLVAIDTWTQDGGAGSDDVIAFITSEGEVALYSGTDPASFSLVGVFTIDRPIGKACTQKYGADLLILTESGVTPLTRAMNAVTSYDAAPDTIRPAFVERAARAKAIHGWDMILYQKNGWLIINVPIQASVFYQHVLNTVTGAWFRFTGWDAKCMQTLNGDLYFASGTTIYKADSGFSDNGAAITGVVTTGWNSFATPQRKSFKMVRPFFMVSGSAKPLVRMIVDYDNSAFDGAPETSIATSGTPWGSPWGSPWSSSAGEASPWISVTGIGTVGAIQMAYKTTTQSVQCNGWSVLLEPGSVL